MSHMMLKGKDCDIPIYCPELCWWRQTGTGLGEGTSWLSGFWSSTLIDIWVRKVNHCTAAFSSGTYISHLFNTFML